MPNNASIINIDKELCTGCRQCADVCPVDAIEGIPGEPQVIDADKCVMCGQCVQTCNGYEAIYEETPTSRSKRILDRGILDSVREPLFAAYNTGRARKVKEVLQNKDLVKIVQCAPAVRVALGEDFGLPLGVLTPGKMVAALKKLGFDKIYDTNFAADLTIMEEGTELIKRVTEGGVLPMFTSCCPAWVKYVEQTYPELMDHLSSCKSPQQMGGAIFKSYAAEVDETDPSTIYSVSVMPCTCKEYEAERPEMENHGRRDVDIVLTTRELGQLIKDAGIDFNQLEDEKYDEPLGTYTGAATIFGLTGGVMEAALRTGYELITKQPIPDVDLTMIRGGEGFRSADVQVGDLTLKVGMVSGLKNAKAVMEDIKAGTCDLHFIEVMTCPEGCVSGGGQPKLFMNTDKELAYDSRKKGLYEHDANLKLRKSHENPVIKKIYDEYLVAPLGHKSHELLHTKYTSKK